MSDFSKSILYSGLVLVAGLIAVFSISSNMTQEDGMNAASFANIEPAAGDATQDMSGTDMFTFVEDTADEATQSAMQEADQITDDALEKLRAALKDAGVDVSEIEPAAGDETTGNVFIDRAPAE